VSDAKSALPPESFTSISMALRNFTDRSGCVWTVWSVQPTVTGKAVQEPLREGWLCFQRAEGGDRYRLPMSEVPATWEELPEERLDLLRRVAVLTPPTGQMKAIGSKAD
jgi:hypothetical protein